MVQHPEGDSELAKGDVKMPTSAFNEMSRKVAERFLQTVVVLDDEAFLRSSRTGQAPVGDLQQPDPRGRSGTVTNPPPSANVAVGQLAATRSKGYELDAEALTEAFANKGLVCAVLAPVQEVGSAVRSAIKAAARADILILDWELSNDGGSTTKDILVKVLEADETSRLRLIAIYTGEPDLGSVRAQAHEALPFLAVIDDADGHAIGSPHIRVVFINKADRPGHGVGESAMPDRLIAEFSKLSMGLLSNTALASLAALRSETHKLLVRFSTSRDSSFVIHRCMIPRPDDSADYALELIADELRAVLEAHAVADEAAGSGAVSKLLDAKAAAGHIFHVQDTEATEGALTVVSLEDAQELIKSGISGAQPDSIWGSKKKLKSLPQRLNALMYNTPRDGVRGNEAFSRLSALKRESHESLLAPANWVPRLSLGTILREPKQPPGPDKYIVCIQPLCDCVRLDTPQEFIFAALDIVEGDSFDFVVHVNNQNLRLKLDAKAHHTRCITFSPAPAPEHFVKASRDGNNNLVFVTDNAESLEWVADLRQMVAQRLVQRMANQLSRVGLDEFEWLRQASGKSD